MQLKDLLRSCNSKICLHFPQISHLKNLFQYEKGNMYTKASIFHKHHIQKLVSLRYHKICMKIAKPTFSTNITMKVLFLWWSRKTMHLRLTFSTKFTSERLFPFMQWENMSSKSNIFHNHYNWKTCSCLVIQTYVFKG